LREKKDRLNQFYRLEDQALGKQADKAFLVFEGRQWTYKEMYQIVLKYGTWLKKTYDIKPKEIVAMDFMNSEKFIFLWFGLWAIGAKPAFINYNLAEKALSHCVKVSTARLALIDPQVQDKFTQELRDGLPGVEFVVLTPELEVEVLSTEGIREPDSARTEDLSRNMAALIYTSGTTGLPKPAIVSWTKAAVAPMLVTTWASIKKDDIFYTVTLPNTAEETC
jgi:acyl-coenzyme A synthetase/AMP-(fatty) acid ligase